MIAQFRWFLGIAYGDIFKRISSLLVTAKLDNCVQIMKWNEKFRAQWKESAWFYIPQQIVQSATKKIKTADNLFLVSKWQDRSAAVDRVKERVSECLKFVFHKKVENRYYDALSLIVCTHSTFYWNWVDIFCCKNNYRDWYRFVKQSVQSCIVVNSNILAS